MKEKREAQRNPDTTRGFHKENAIKTTKWKMPSRPVEHMRRRKKRAELGRRKDEGAAVVLIYFIRGEEKTRSHNNRAQIEILIPNDCEDEIGDRIITDRSI